MRVNPAMEEAVAAWKDARCVPTMLLTRISIQTTTLLFVDHLCYVYPKKTKPENLSLNRSRVKRENGGLFLHLPLGRRHQKYQRTNPPTYPHQTPVKKICWLHLVVHVVSSLSFLVLNISADNVECPICSRVMPLTSINSHIDKGCPSPSSSSSLLKKAEKKKTSVGQWGKLLGGGGGERSKSRKGKEKFVFDYYFHHSHRY